jgi:hypothetical protein
VPGVFSCAKRSQNNCSLMELTCRFDRKLQVKVRSFREPFRIEVRTA